MVVQLFDLQNNFDCLASSPMITTLQENCFSLQLTSKSCTTVQPLANTHLIVPQKSKVLDTEEIDKWQVSKSTFSNL